MTLSEERIPLPQVSDAIHSLLLDPRQLWLYAINGQSTADVFDLRKRNLNGRYELLKDGSNRITTVTSLLGGISIMIGDAKGGIQQWFMVRDADGKPLAGARIRPALLACSWPPRLGSMTTWPFNSIARD